ncbi:hypothetical protein V1283_003183 [Bradyrhizobium sp. AZCC 2262]|uniref:DUF5413 family protein n=1 Tax=Bradyrhizobium sp. AZCC 2262 TaxID=3117022 RepID=UPI002FF0C01E
MKRFLIFAAIAPPLGFVVAFWVMLQIANWLAGSPITFDVAQIMMLPTIYLVGLIPALLAGWFDHALARRNVSYRIALTAPFGYAISYLPLAVAFWIGFGHGPYVLLFGLIGAVPSAVCSWLAAERQAPDLCSVTMTVFAALAGCSPGSVAGAVRTVVRPPSAVAPAGRRCTASSGCATRAG